MNHTPGPWSIEGDNKTLIGATDGKEMIASVNSGHVVERRARSLNEAQAHLQGPRAGLLELLEEQRAALESHVTALKAGLLDGRFLTQPAALFKIRIALAEATASAVQFELQASGGKAYLSAYGSAFARRWRESAFVPIVTPSLVQLRAELQRQSQASAQ